MILLAAALKEPSAWDGVVLMGPLIHIDPALASPVKLWAARILSRVTPQLAVYNQLKFLFRQKETVINSNIFTVVFFFLCTGWCSYGGRYYPRRKYAGCHQKRPARFYGRHQMQMGQSFFIIF